MFVLLISGTVTHLSSQPGTPPTPCSIHPSNHPMFTGTSLGPETVLSVGVQRGVLASIRDTVLGLRGPERTGGWRQERQQSV